MTLRIRSTIKLIDSCRIAGTAHQYDAAEPRGTLRV
jgi:hypothetical protein